MICHDFSLEIMPFFQRVFMTIPGQSGYIVSYRRRIIPSTTTIENQQLFKRKLSDNNEKQN